MRLPTAPRWRAKKGEATGPLIRRRGDLLRHGPLWESEAEGEDWGIGCMQGWHAAHKRPLIGEAGMDKSRTCHWGEVGGWGGGVIANSPPVLSEETTMAREGA